MVEAPTYLWTLLSAAMAQGGKNRGRVYTGPPNYYNVRTPSGEQLAGNCWLSQELAQEESLGSSSKTF